MENVRVTYRGWAGHFICGHKCIFRLNTLLEYSGTRIVVSTVGLLPDPLNKGRWTTIGVNRHFETMAFHAEKNGEFWDANVQQEVEFESEWSWEKIEDEWKANKGHVAVVEEIKQGLLDGKYTAAGGGA